MEHSEESLFALTIDPTTKAHLWETARWARFLAIVGMVIMGLLVLLGVFASTILSSAFDQLDSDSGASRTVFSGYGIGFTIVYIIIALIWFFPLLFLLRFANKMKAALAGNDQQALTTSAQNLKVFFRYVGIITLIVLALYALIFLFAILGAAVFS